MILGVLKTFPKTTIVIAPSKSINPISLLRLGDSSEEQKKQFR